MASPLENRQLHPILGAAGRTRLDGRALTEEIQKAVRDHSTEGLRFVLYVDEAHSLPNNALEVLTELHIGGLGETDQIPCVVVLTGLAHTKRNLNAHPGLTRAGDGTAMNMTAMGPEECVQSTTRMLAELCPSDAPWASAHRCEDGISQHAAVSSPTPSATSFSPQRSRAGTD